MRNPLFFHCAFQLAGLQPASYAPKTMHVAVFMMGWLATGAGPASADEGASPIQPDMPIEITLPSPDERLKEAVYIYQTGAPKNAQAMLAGIVNDRSYDDESLRQRARVFLGEVLYLQQSEEEARRVFETVLTLEPNYVIDPFEHPPDVCGFFETIRTYIRPAESASMVTTAPVPPTPFNAYLGFGMYQLRHKERSLGIAMAIGQTTFGIISATMFASLLQDRGYNAGAENERRAVHARRTAQWAATTGFYGFWAWSAVDANRHWRTNVEMHTASARSGGVKNGKVQQMGVQFTFPTR